MRRYRYVGPEEIRARGGAVGTPIRERADLDPFATGAPLTFVIDTAGVLRVADRRSEHVACAGGGDVMSAGELTAERSRSGCIVVAVSNQSTGYCPERESWPSVAAALDAAGIPHPGCFTFEAVFRRCPSCGERNLVKDDWFECAMCGSALPEEWNFG
jgi:hypothetical protein